MEKRANRDQLIAQIAARQYGVITTGEGAVLSHRSAAELWELLPAAQG